MKNKLEKQMLDAMSKNPNNWKGVFYFNPKDPRVVVPKLYSSMGWTLNFACPYAYLSLAGIILVIILSMFLL